MRRLHDTLCTPIAHSVICVVSCSVLEQCYAYVCVCLCNWHLLEAGWHVADCYVLTQVHHFVHFSSCPRKGLSGIERSSETCHAISAVAVIAPIRLLAFLATCSMSSRLIYFHVVAGIAPFRPVLGLKKTNENAALFLRHLNLSEIIHARHPDPVFVWTCKSSKIWKHLSQKFMGSGKIEEAIAECKAAEMGFKIYL